MIDLSTAGRPFDHVAIAVHSIEESGRLYELLTGEASSQPEVLESQGVRVTFTGSIELLEPLGPDTTVGRFLARRGPGLHHIAYRTDDLVAEMSRLDAAGLRLIDTEPHIGARGRLAAFVHPSSTGGVLVEFVEHLP